MSSYSFAFLFDYESFKAKVTPALEALVNGSSRELQQVALDFVIDNPNIWDFVEYSRVPLYDDDDEKGIDDVVDAGVLPWLLLVISNYCSKVYKPVDFRIFRQLGIDEDVIRMLTQGRPLGDLLIKIEPKIIPNDYVNEDININDCPIDWLSIEDIEKIMTIIEGKIEHASTSSFDIVLTVLHNAIASKKAVIIGSWFN